MCFVSSLWLLALLVIIQALVVVTSGDISVVVLVMNIVLTVLGVLVWLFVSILLFFHIFLTIRNETTN